MMAFIFWCDRTNEHIMRYEIIVFILLLLLLMLWVQKLQSNMMQLAPQVRVRVRLWRIWVNFRERVCHDVFGESRSTAFQIKQTLDIVRNQYPCGKAAQSFERNGTFPGPPNSLVKCTRKPYTNVKKHTHAHCTQVNEFVMKKWCNNVTTKRNGTHLLRWIHVRQTQTAWIFSHYVQIVFLRV